MTPLMAWDAYQWWGMFLCRSRDNGSGTLWRLQVPHDTDSLSSGGQRNRRKHPTNLFNPDALD